ncbi:MAG: hypothetical protein A2600_06385 [Candidatus Lambdaproteobacteria bacterium RIFOXYD1_FULL_56_27]|uniref:Metal-dependent hydrolase n=1 Tax=Candidatus Lambdaproteobacteria bacterium RIFOXYD2_FULL_56_26 TaxID=1817773 RepID=A0A1F6H0B4_9PROT|nr:MAG: hypothetical protein A2426_00985 [Candidatus Lambdaproteobacteria bacterium RIFOXYC1_FULL_56_13]OGH03835.1 MAG: hypothetical protein A2557_11895 [Candidatus Lambdaproteobacteria bacterium RIFOXYD2_FULL_56_26]OGH08963.1 MAG: hypothetical protein A2600_06385 [Candidatus Lambdaproteobacteria bacterium RIFOXYD1_FULL_56_27]
MNFKAHLTGGVLVGFGCVAGATALGWLQPEQMNLDRPWGGPEGVKGLLLFTATLAMSLFPDLDQASKPQRWYYRAVFVLLVALFVGKQFPLFAAVTFFSLLPLTHKHRGWTHSWVAPLVVFGFWWGFLALHQQISVTPDWGALGGKLRADLPYLGAAWLGHSTHLLLDRFKAG